MGTQASSVTSMDFDCRTRTAADIVQVDLAEFHAGSVPRMLEEHGALASRAFASSGLSEITLAMGELAWTWHLDGDGALRVVEGDGGAGARANLDAEWFSDLVNDVRSTVALMISGEPVMVRGGVNRLIAFEPVLRALIDGRPAYESGLVDFTDPRGAPLDLGQSFRLDDDPEELRRFLSQAGFLHFRGVFEPFEMAELSAEIDMWRSRMTPDDERAWYATVDGERVCVRVTNLSRTDVAFPHEMRLSPIAELVGSGQEYAATDLLVKPVGVSEGISDLPWHKDCSLGLHSYNCTSMTCGVSVTGSGPANGQLGVLAGSHRVNLPLFDVADGIDMPMLWLSTEPGDVTVHLSCTMHCATPPVHSERRVTYSSLRFPGDPELGAQIKAVRDQAGRETYAPG